MINVAADGEISGPASLTRRADAEDAWPATFKRIAVFRALVLGDMLCSVPALRALRKANPDARITLIGLPWATAFIDLFPDLIDDLMVFPGAVGFPEQTETDDGLPAFFEKARRREFDLAIQLHGSGGIANDLLLALGARHNAGFHQPDEVPRPGRFLLWPDALAESERYDALIRFLDMPVEDTTMTFPVRDTDRHACAALAAEHGIEFERLVCIHPGAQLPSRRWPAERFAKVADGLAADGWQIAITGSQSELMLTSAVLGAMNAPALHLCGLTTLRCLGALVSKSRLLVCNDTGLSHIAVGVATPSVVIASGSDTRRWSPVNRVRHHVLADYPSCRPCSYKVCPIGHPCALNVGVPEVLAAARDKLAAFGDITLAGASLHRRSYGHHV